MDFINALSYDLTIESLVFEEMKSLFHALSKNTFIRELIISFNHFSCGDFFADFLKLNNPLTSLDISGNDISEEGINLKLKNLSIKFGGILQ
eukprot:gene11646-4886_t